MGEFNVDKTTGDLIDTAGMPSEYPATQVMMSDGVTSVEDALDELSNITSISKSDLLDESTKSAEITVNKFQLQKIDGLPLGRLRIDFYTTGNSPSGGLVLGALKNEIIPSPRLIAPLVDDTETESGGCIYINTFASSGSVRAYNIKANRTYILDCVTLLLS